MPVLANEYRQTALGPQIFYLVVELEIQIVW